MDAYETVAHIFSAIFGEVKELAKRKPDVTFTKAKVVIVNCILEDVREVRRDEPDGKYLDLLDDDQLPQFSDAVIVMSQYAAALSKFHGRYYGWNGFDYSWRVE